LRSVSISWYEWTMLKSYLAIVDNAGLREIHEEHDSTAPVLSRKLNHRSHPCTLIWLVLSVRNFKAIRYQLWLGNRREALVQMQTLAEQMGGVSVSAPTESLA